ncbi:MAG: sugar phosphate isomerase/epimerase [Clostridia bacterium]|nr:sugar phosphate isomerase/epimerase [Clostridia bacterium]
MITDRYKLGLVSVSFRQHSPKEILEAAKKEGLSCIEWGSDVHAPCNDTARLTEISAMQKEYGIACSSYGTYFRFGETPIEELEHYIAAAKILGTDTLRLWCGRKRNADMTDGERDELLSLCRQAAAIAEANGVTLCLECHKKTFTEDPEDAVWLMNAVNSKHFLMYWQPFQWQSFEQNIENAKKLAPYVRHIHVFNWKGEEKFPLSDAVEEWQRYLRKLCAPRTLLLEFMPNDGIDELAREAATLKTIIGETV